MKNLFFFLLILALATLQLSCSKNKNGEKLYNGTIVGIQDGCFLRPAQYPYIIRFDDVTELDENHPVRIIPGLDSSCIALIPDEYKVIGKKIRFGFRKRNADEEFTCNASVLLYYPVILTDISSN